MLDRWEGDDRAGWARRLGLAAAEFHARLDSTNRRARELAVEGGPVPALVLADRQTAGRGRQGRSWQSDDPGGLWLSLVEARGRSAALLPLVAGLAVLEAAEELLGKPWAGTLTLKWPNDVYADGGKLAGILCEALGDRVVVGIGVNVNQTLEALPVGLDVPPTSLLHLGGSPVARGKLLQAIVVRWRELRRSLSEDGVGGEAPLLPPGLVAELNKRSAVVGRPVAVRGMARHSNGRLGAVDDEGATGGLILPDGALTYGSEGRTSALVAGSVRILGHR